MEGICEDSVVLWEELWSGSPRPCGQLISALRIRLLYGLRDRRCLSQNLTDHRAQQLVAAVVDFLVGSVQVHSFLSKILLFIGGPKSTLGAKGNPAFPICWTSSSVKSVNPRGRKKGREIGGGTGQ